MGQSEVGIQGWWNSYPYLNESLFFSNQKRLTEDKKGLISRVHGESTTPLYIGWIPCLAGQLFFGFSEPGLSHFDQYSFNILKLEPETGAPVCRYVLSTSAYDWKDSGRRDEIGLSRMVFAAKAETASKLVGVIYVIPFQTNLSDCKKDLAQYRLAKFFDDLATSQKEADENRSSSSWRDFQEKYFNLFSFEREKDNAFLTEEISDENLFVHRILFEIDDAGFCFLNYAGTKKRGSKKFEIINLKDSGNYEDAYTLTRQSFYYLKYTFHKHSHHHHGNDSLTTIHRLSSKGELTTMSLLRDLKRALVQDKRAKRFDTHDAVGIANYGKSLVISSKRLGFFSDERKKPLSTSAGDPSDFQKQYFDHLSESIRLLRNSNLTSRERLKNSVTSFQQAVSIPFLFFTPAFLVVASRVKLSSSSFSNYDVCADSSLPFLERHLLNIACAKNGLGNLYFWFFFFIFIAALYSFFVRNKPIGYDFFAKLRGHIAKNSFMVHHSRLDLITWQSNRLFLFFSELKNNLRTEKNHKIYIAVLLIFIFFCLATPCLLLMAFSVLSNSPS
ncbi:hypothetical protein [Marichromatium purpuratum]|uniref:hypothetical protein n=1 Tax=Marichromatium purpuratum TaxID=37487 RepID=UPI00021E6394|nr:hypothetical protein [Marichromatium purpuratum]